MKYRYIAFEGIDGAGTTTQSRRLRRHLNGRAKGAILTREPSDLPTGVLIRELLRSGELSASYPWLFAADRAAHLSEVVQPALRRGKAVISDRCIVSSLAYQGSTYGLQGVVELNRRFALPEVIVFLDCSVEVAMERLALRGADRDIYEQRHHLERHRDHYDAALSYMKGRGVSVSRVDSTQPIDRVEAEVRAALGVV